MSKSLFSLHAIVSHALGGYFRIKNGLKELPFLEPVILFKISLTMMSWNSTPYGLT